MGGNCLWNNCKKNCVVPVVLIIGKILEKLSISKIDFHKFFLCKFQVEAHFKPTCKGAGDTSNFDDYEEEPLRISSTEKCAKEFADF